MGEIALTDAENLADRCLDACNAALRTGDAAELEALLTADAVIEISEATTDHLSGARELAARLEESAHHQGLVLIDVHTDGADVVTGVAWEDDPWTRVAEVRLVTDGRRISRLEWVR